MGVTKQTALVRMLVEDLNTTFLREFARRMPTVWAEAVSRSHADEDVDKALKPYYFGQTRYTLVQSMFLGVGRDCGLDARVIPCEQNNFPIPMVSVGRFHFTAHGAFNPTEMSVVNASLVRQQHSAVNKELVQPKLFGGTFDEAKLLAASDIQANIIFGCGGNGRNFDAYGFLRIAVPCVEKVNPKYSRDKFKVYFVENYDYFDIVQLVIDKEKAQQKQPMIDIAVPQIKKPKLLKK